MWQMIAGLLGGLGLFLLGMILMTDALKALAGSALRAVLARFTGTRLAAVTTGTLVTTLVQSSSATTLATIGFVSAGLLSFENAIGVIIGANIGSTSTGWLVGLLGIKLSIGTLLLPLIGLGALARLLGRGRLAQVGTAIAGFGVIFVGIDLLQAGMGDLSQNLSPADCPAAGLGGRALLVAIGLALTVVIQSSGAAVAATLTGLASGAIDLQQAAALVVGMNLGTTATAVIGALGASAAARRTAAVHVLFNTGTGMVFFFSLPWVVDATAWLADGLWGDEPTLTLAAFHTAFNLIGLLLFLPFVGPLARAATRLFPERRSRFGAQLDPALRSLPAMAHAAAVRAQGQVGAALFGLVARLLRRDQTAGAESIDELDTALDEVRHYLAGLPPPANGAPAIAARIAALHVNEHLERLVQDARKREHLAVIARQADLDAAARSLAALLDARAAELAVGQPADVQAIQDFSARLADERRTARPAIIAATATQALDPDQALAALSAQRWIDRLAYHVWRCCHHARVMVGATPLPRQPPAADD